MTTLLLFTINITLYELSSCIFPSLNYYIFEYIKALILKETKIESILDLISSFLAQSLSIKFQYMDILILEKNEIDLIVFLFKIFIIHFLKKKYSNLRVFSYLIKYWAYLTLLQYYLRKHLIMDLCFSKHPHWNPLGPPITFNMLEYDIYWH